MPLGPAPLPSRGAKLIWHPSPNFGPRKGGLTPSLVVLHYTAMGSFEAARDRLCDPEFEVSAHFLISQDGEVCQMVDEKDRAWHAGAGAWGSCTDVNSASIGIELCNRGDHAFPEAQMVALLDLLKTVRARWNVVPERVIGHSDMALGRKQDPGRHFDWSVLAAKGHAVFRSPATGRILPFLLAAEKFGYSIPDDKRATEIVLEAFRQRFRPQAKGPLDDDDVRILSDLAHNWPVDAVDRSA